MLLISGWSGYFYLFGFVSNIDIYDAMFFILSFCRALESIMSKFWWQKLGGRRGIHWCSWATLRVSKCDVGMGFQDLAQFNVTFLTKKDWHLLTDSGCLLSRVH